MAVNARNSQEYLIVLLFVLVFSVTQVSKGDYYNNEYVNTFILQCWKPLFRLISLSF